MRADHDSVQRTLHAQLSASKASEAALTGRLEKEVDARHALDDSYAQRSRELASRIEGRFGVGTVLVDERMTSLEAERVLKSGERAFERGDIDKLSAVLLLQSYLDERSKR